MALAFAASTLRLHFGISVAQPYMILSLQSPSTATALFDSNATSQFDFQNFSGGLAHLILGIAKITF